MGKEGVVLSPESSPRESLPESGAAILERDLRALLETLPHLVFSVLPSGAIEYLNGAVYAYTGKAPGDLREWDWAAFTHPDDLAVNVAAWQRAVEDGANFACEARLLGRDGLYRWFLTRGSAVRDAATGAIVRWIGTATDVDALHGAADRNAFLVRADDLFGAELDPDAIMRSVAHASVASFAEYVLFDLAGDDGVVRRAAVDHRDPSRRGPFADSLGQAPPLDHPVSPIAAAWRSGESVLVPRIDPSWWERAASDGAHFERMRGEGLASLITVVISSRGRRYGLLTFCRSRASQPYKDADVATVEDLARRVGAALENARLYQEARASAEAQRRIAERESFYARLGESLSEALDLRATLDVAARLLVPSFADWALVNLIDDEGTLFLAASHHHDPVLDARARNLINLRYLSADAPSGSPAAVRTKQPLLYERIDGRGIGGVSAPYRETFASFGVVSAAVVPIAYGGTVRGTITIQFDRTSNRRYAQDDLPFFIEVGRRLSPAIANAEAYERERRVARTFQAAALTTELPRVPGTSFDALYEAGSSEALIGGDWYDAFRVADGRIVMSVGDVAGSGLDAAATMATIRQSLRGAAAINPEPSVMLDAADRVLRSQAPERFVTAWVGVMDPLWATLTCAGAGHPAPMLRAADGAVSALPGGGLPLGLRERGQDVTRHVDLSADTTLLLYTDGLIEARRDVIAGERALVAALREADIESAPAQAIHQAVLGGTEASDDVALLVVAFRRSLLALHGEDVARRWRFHADDGFAAAAARAAMVSALRTRGVDELDCTMAELVYAELIGNAKRYAPGSVDVALDLSGDYAVLHAVDDGAGFQHNARLPTDALAESGRGLFIVSQVAEEFAVTRCPGGGAHARAVLKGRLTGTAEVAQTR